MKNKFYVTTPIYYVNDQPHIGHAYTTLLADVLARYQRRMGADTFFLTGTDEHGQKVQQAAIQNGITPQEQADRTVVRFQSLWQRLLVTNDDFIRTTESRHTRMVQKVLQDLFDRGEIYRAEYDGWYDVSSETFVTEKDLPVERTPENMKNFTQIREANYFFRMSKYQEWLIQHIEEHPKFIQPDSRRNETLGFLRKPLTDLCISRPKKRLAWGIELPFDKDFVTYVWFDALLNYITAVGYGADETKFQRWWPASVQLIGKDILTTHTVYWPTMLKAMNVPLPETVFAHGWWLSGRTKMSKSLGNVVNPMEMIDRYGLDAFRYFLIAEMNLGQDAAFTEEAFIRRYNADLANDLGNLLNRLTKMIATYCGGVLPTAPAESAQGAEEAEVRQFIQSAVDQMQRAVETYHLDSGVAEVIAAVRASNRYLEKKQPWTLAKQADKTPLNTTLYTAAEVLRIAAGLLLPIMPEKMAQLQQALGWTGQEVNFETLRQWGQLPGGAVVTTGQILFPRIEPVAAEPVADILQTVVETKAQAAPAIPAKPTAELISYEDFLKVDLRTARVLSAEKIVGADKLLKLEIEVGAEKRQLVAGVAQFYKPEEMVGRTIVVVANLKPAKIRGVESQGMLLAADTGAGLRVLSLDHDVPSGGRVK